MRLLGWNFTFNQRKPYSYDLILGGCVPFKPGPDAFPWSKFSPCDWQMWSLWRVLQNTLFQWCSTNILRLYNKWVCWTDKQWKRSWKIRTKVFSIFSHKHKNFASFKIKQNFFGQKLNIKGVGALFVKWLDTVQVLLFENCISNVIKSAYRTSAIPAKNTKSY